MVPTTPPTQTWTVSIDRRSANPDDIVRELTALAESIDGLSLRLNPRATFDQAPDAGAFRDFVALASISHHDRRVLDFVAESLLTSFGWLVDFRPPHPPQDGSHPARDDADT